MLRHVGLRLEQVDRYPHEFPASSRLDTVKSSWPVGEGPEAELDIRE